MLACLLSPRTASNINIRYSICSTSVRYLVAATPCTGLSSPQEAQPRGEGISWWRHQRTTADRSHEPATVHRAGTLHHHRSSPRIQRTSSKRLLSSSFAAVSHKTIPIHVACIACIEGKKQEANWLDRRVRSSMCNYIFSRAPAPFRSTLLGIIAGRHEAEHSLSGSPPYTHI